VELVQPHDEFFKLIFSDPKRLAELIENFCPSDLVQSLELSTLRILPTEKIGSEKRKYLDLVAECQTKNKDYAQFYFIFEHKSQPDRYAFIQIMHYMVSIWEENVRQNKDLVPIIPVIYYHGQVLWPHPRNLIDLFKVEEALKKYLSDFKYLLVDTNLISDEKLKEDMENLSALAIVLYVMKNIRLPLEELAQAFKALIELLRINPQEPTFILFYSVVSYVSKAKGVEPEEMENILFKTGGEEMRTVFDKWREEGIQQGILQGLYKGAVEEARNLVLEALETRFGAVEPHISNRIKTIEDRDILKSLHRTAILAGSIEEFEQKLRTEVQFLG
jgi:predicted transposase/invertase (TIGR01784 family)